MAKVSPSLAVITVFSLAALVGFWMLLMPEIRELGRQQAQFGKLKLPQASSNSLGESTRAAQVRTRDTALTLLPIEDAQYDLATQIEALSASTGVVLSSYSVAAGGTAKAAATPAPTAEEGGTASASPAPAAASVSTLQKLTLSLTFSGSYDDIQRYVNALLSINRFMQIDQITLTGSQSSAAIAAQLTAFAYYQPVAVPAAK